MTPTPALDEYQILRRIGGGNMGLVYLAIRLETGQQVAIKVVSGGSSAEDQEKIAIEKCGAELQERLGQADDRVVKVNRVIMHNDDLVVEMEYVPGENLTRVIQQGPMPVGRAARIGLELCDMLDHLDCGEPVVHGDLKPGNVLLADEAQPKVVDFGIAKQLSHAGGTFNPYQSLPYSSPERLITGMVDQQSDLWAVAVMLYEMVAARHPFAAAGENVRARILSGAGPDLLPATCPEPLKNIILKALASARAERYAQAGYMAEDLRRFLAGQPVEARAPDENATRRTRPPQSDATVRTGSPGGMRKPARITWTETNRKKTVFAVAAFLTGLVAFFVGSQIQASRKAAEIRQALESDRMPVSEAWDQYTQLRARARLPLLLAGLEDTLKKKLMEAGSEPILDYRLDQPTSREGDWLRAARDFQHVLEIDPRNQLALARERLCEGHLLRIRSRSLNGRRITYNQRLLNQAIERFGRASELAPDSPDPYLGLMHLYIYDSTDYTRGLEMMREARKRGHAMGKREQVQMADALRARAIRSVQQAQQFEDTPDRQRQFLESALADLDAAIQGYTELIGFTKNIENLLQDTRRRREGVQGLIDGVPALSSAK